MLCDDNDEMYQWMMRAILYKRDVGGERIVMKTEIDWWRLQPTIFCPSKAQSDGLVRILKAG